MLTCDMGYVMVQSMLDAASDVVLQPWSVPACCVIFFQATLDSGKLLEEALVWLHQILQYTRGDRPKRSGSRFDLSLPVHCNITWMYDCPTCRQAKTLSTVSRPLDVTHMQTWRQTWGWLEVGLWDCHHVRLRLLWFRLFFNELSKHSHRIAHQLPAFAPHNVIMTTCRCSSKITSSSQRLCYKQTFSCFLLRLPGCPNIVSVLELNVTKDELF